MKERHGSTALLVAAVLNGVFGLVLLAGGAWLISLGGSWFYVVAGLLLLAVAGLLVQRRPAAIWLYALLLLLVLVWSLWEAGLDWWPIAARGDVFVLLGLFMLTPWVRRALIPTGARTDAESRVTAAGDTTHSRRRRVHHTAMPLWGAIVAFFLVAIASWMVDPHRQEGELPTRTSELARSPVPVPEGEWHAYGRTNFGQRYSPLAQITPENVKQLEVAWHYKTGDMRGQPGDPEETTFEVTPLKIGERLYICTPHQSVVALNATTGEEVWRYDPRIRGELALQHLTCRGLSYHPGNGNGQDTSAASVTQLEQDNGEQETASSDTQASEVSSEDTGSQSAEQQINGEQEGRQLAVSAQQEALKRLNLPVATEDANAKTADSCTAKLFMPTADGRIIALNPEDGAVCADFGGGTGQINLWANMPNARVGGYYSTSPVVVTQNLIIVGGTVLDNVSTDEPAGVIRAFNVNTGELVWNWDPANPEDTAPIAPDAVYTPTTPNSWSISSADEELGMVYVPMGNQPPDQWGGNRGEAADNYASAVVALDLETGKVRWAFQTVHHDLWDYDVPSQPSLIDLTINGETVPAVVQPTKQGEVYVLDRRTGEPVLPVTETPYPQGVVEGDRSSPTQPVSKLSFDPVPLTGASMWGATIFDQLACRIEFHSLRYEGRYTPPSTQGTLVYPGNFGVFNWGGVAVDPQRQVVFATPTYLAFISKLIPREDDTSLYVQGENRPQDSLPALNENFGAPYAVELSAFTSFLGLPCQQPPWGYVAGADLTTGEVAWMHKNGTVRDSSPLPLPFKMGVPNLGGPIITAGGVAFLSSTLDYYLRAYDLTTGEELWKGRLPAGGQATPMTYSGSDGRQYVVVAAGGHGSLGTKAGDDLIAFALPSR